MTREIRRGSLKYNVHQTIRPTIAPLTAAVSGALAASSLQAATITVDTLADGFPDGQCSLRAALYSATSNNSIGTCTSGDLGEDTIEFEPGLSGTITLSHDGETHFDGYTLPVGESVTINGDNRITLQGTGNGPVLYLKYDPDGFAADSVTLEGLTITGGGGNYGGAIHALSRELRVNNCTLTDNSAVNGGGAIWRDHPIDRISRTSIFHSVISGNETTGANSRGGAIAINSTGHQLDFTFATLENNQALGSGGAVDWQTENGLANITSSNTFYNNTAKYGDGGAVNVVASGGYGVVVIARDSEFSSNVATGYGGAISIHDTGTGKNNFGNFRMLGSTFESNLAGNNGGAVRFHRGDGYGTVGEPENEVLTDISPYSGDPTVFSNNGAAYSGGAVDITVGDATPILLYDTEFHDNQAYDGDGGAAVLRTGNAGLAMSDITIEGNVAEGSGNGGGMYVEAGNGGNAEGQNVVLINNQGAYGGGLRVVASGGDVGFGNSRFIDNTATTSYGGGLSVTGTLGSFGIGYSVFSGNTASAMGGGMDVFSPASESILFEIKYSEWSGNEAGNHGGAINFELGTNSQAFVENSTLSGNTSGGRGGALHSTASQSLALKYSTMADNYAAIEGGGLYTDLASGCEVYNTILAGNTVGAGAEQQDLRGGSYYCDVRDSLIAGHYSEFNNDGGNVLYQDPLLQPLADNGGSAGRTHALGEGSPAIDAGNAGDFVPDYDQRGTGFVRIFGGELDMGAYEARVDKVFVDRFESTP